MRVARSFRELSAYRLSREGAQRIFQCTNTSTDFRSIEIRVEEESSRFSDALLSEFFYHSPITDHHSHLDAGEQSSDQ
jgi:hypothetical protein